MLHLRTSDRRMATGRFTTTRKEDEVRHHPVENEIRVQLSQPRTMSLSHAEGPRQRRSELARASCNPPSRRQGSTVTDRRTIALSPPLRPMSAPRTS